VVGSTVGPPVDGEPERSWIAALHFRTGSSVGGVATKRTRVRLSTVKAGPSTASLAYRQRSWSAAMRVRPAGALSFARAIPRDSTSAMIGARCWAGSVGWVGWFADKSLGLSIAEADGSTVSWTIGCGWTVGRRLGLSKADYGRGIQGKCRSPSSLPSY
jgi:hypothetical protein